jgi:hypothetical protein
MATRYRVRDFNGFADRFDLQDRFNTNEQPCWISAGTANPTDKGEFDLNQVLEALPQMRGRPPDARLHRPKRHAEVVGDLVMGPFIEIG